MVVPTTVTLLVVPSTFCDSVVRGELPSIQKSYYLCHGRSVRHSETGHAGGRRGVERYQLINEELSWNEADEDKAVAKGTPVATSAPTSDVSHKLLVFEKGYVNLLQYFVGKVQLGRSKCEDTTLKLLNQ